MKHLKLFESFSEEDIHSICRKYGIENYTINEDGSIDVDGDVDFYSKSLTKLPLKFRKVTGYFICNNNYLTTLEGCPESVGGVFWCNRNYLASLEGCPNQVGDEFDLANNNIISFEHLPLSIGGLFFCGKNPIFEIWKLFKDYDKIELFNYYDIIRNNNIIILDRLNCFLEEIGKPTVNEVKGYKCI